MRIGRNAPIRSQTDRGCQNPIITGLRSSKGQERPLCRSQRAPYPTLTGLEPKVVREGRKVVLEGQKWVLRAKIDVWRSKSGPGDPEKGVLWVTTHLEGKKGSKSDQKWDPKRTPKKDPKKGPFREDYRGFFRSKNDPFLTPKWTQT